MPSMHSNQDLQSHGFWYLIILPLLNVPTLPLQNEPILNETGEINKRWGEIEVSETVVAHVGFLTI